MGKEERDDGDGKKERMERGMIAERNKKGVSVMVSYVLLLSIVVTLSIIVGGWIYFQAKNPPVGGESCEGVTVSADNFCCYALDGGTGGGGIGETCNSDPDCQQGLVCIGGICQQGQGNPCENVCTPDVGECLTNGNQARICDWNVQGCWRTIDCAGCTNTGGPTGITCTGGLSGPAEKKENWKVLSLQNKQKMIKFSIINTGRFTVQNVLVRVETLPEVGEVFRFALPRNTMPITPNNYTNYTTAVTGMGDGKLRWLQLVPVTSTLCSSQAVDFRLPEECSKSADELPASCPRKA